MLSCLWLREKQTNKHLDQFQNTFSSIFLAISEVPSLSCSLRHIAGLKSSQCWNLQGLSLKCLFLALPFPLAVSIYFSWTEIRKCWLIAARRNAADSFFASSCSSFNKSGSHFPHWKCKEQICRSFYDFFCDLFSFGLTLSRISFNTGIFGTAVPQGATVFIYHPLHMLAEGYGCLA